jgi:hypothetical protein
MAVVRDYTRAFFDKYLKGVKTPLLDGKAKGEFVEVVERLGPVKQLNKDR